MKVIFTFFSSKPRRFSLLAVALFTTAFAIPPLAHSQGNLRHQIEQTRADLDSLRRFYDTRLSEKGLARVTGFIEKAHAGLMKRDFEALPRTAQVDWVLLRNYLDQRLADQAWRVADLEADKPYVPFLPTLMELDGYRLSGKAFKAEDAADSLAAMLKDIQAGRKAVEKEKKVFDEAEKKRKEAEEAKKSEEESEENSSDAEEPAEVQNPFPPWRVYRLVDRINQSKGVLDTWYRHYSKFQPGFDWWVKAPYEKAKKDLSEYEKWLREKVAGIKDRKNGPLFGERVGDERLEALIRFEMIPYSAKELLEIAEKEFAWCENEMKKAAKEMGLETREEALAAIKKKHVPAGEQGRYVADVAREATDFVLKKKLVSVPPLARETWRVKMVDENQQKTLPYAAYSGQNVLVAFATGPMDQGTKEMSMEGNNQHSSRLVVPHEVIPGHHLQLFMGDRHRQDRKLFRTSFFVEGWALHWEMKLWDEGWARSPEDRIGMLFWRMHRCARVIVTLKFHRDEMDPNEMVTFLTDRIGHGENQAKAEVRRYIASSYSALYQVAYMIGGKQLRALHKELVIDGEMTERAFHDKVLRLGPIPVEMIRAEMKKDVPLSKNWETNWRF